MSFQIYGLNHKTFSPLFDLSDAELKAKGGVRKIAQSDTDFPCRISLQDAKKGESVILINYEHQSADTPYRSCAAIFIRENVRSAKLAANEIPTQFSHRLMAGHAFDEHGMMIDANICAGSDLDEMLNRLLGLEYVSYVHLHYAKHGCFAGLVKSTNIKPTD